MVHADLLRVSTIDLACASIWTGWLLRYLLTEILSFSFLHHAPFFHHALLLAISPSWFLSPYTVSFISFDHHYISPLSVDPRPLMYLPTLLRSTIILLLQYPILFYITSPPLQPSFSTSLHSNILPSSSRSSPTRPLPTPTYIILPPSLFHSHHIFQHLHFHHT